MKNIVFETSYIKNIEYDIDNISEVCQKLETFILLANHKELI